MSRGAGVNHPAPLTSRFRFSSKMRIDATLPVSNRVSMLLREREREKQAETHRICNSSWALTTP